MIPYGDDNCWEVRVRFPCLFVYYTRRGRIEFNAKKRRTYNRESNGIRKDITGRAKGKRYN